MSQQHLITPPPELVKDWARYQNGQDPEALWFRIATLAAQWGADQELEACCKWLPKLPPWSANDLRKHRRPKPTSLKEQALADLDSLVSDLSDGMGIKVTNIIRALEALDD